MEALDFEFIFSAILSDLQGRDPTFDALTEADPAYTILEVAALHITIQDDGPDTYTLLGFGLYLEDSILFALYGQSGVILEKSTQATLLLATDICFTDLDGTALSFGDTSWINPPATTDTPGVVALATEEEGIAGTERSIASTPKGRKAALGSCFGEGAHTDFCKTLLAQETANAAREHLGLGNAATQDQGPDKGLNADTLDENPPRPDGD
ncbi:hypothetical protein [uncultured Microbulbifer sp.]|uniref:hypothetical protein n=1 Tax=uncultured Microbulbifer sp. TaxID=348147 RepID=UPI00261A21B8|nr:hypothetical protein [uncultured Microbulbifer sp.]